MSEVLGIASAIFALALCASLTIPVVTLLVLGLDSAVSWWKSR